MVKDGDCLSTIAERELHMNGKKGTSSEINDEVDRLIALNKGAHPKIGCNRDYVQADWKLTINAPEAAAPAPAPVPVVEAPKPLIEAAKPVEAPPPVAPPAPIVIEAPPPPPVVTAVPVEAPPPPPPPQVVDRLTIPIEAFIPAAPPPPSVIIPMETRPERPHVDSTCHDQAHAVL